MNGDVRKREADHRPNGLPPKPIPYTGGTVSETKNGLPNGVQTQLESKSMTNGVGKGGMNDAAATKFLADLKQLPPEIEEIAREYFVSLGPLISRAAQESWNQLSNLIDSRAVQKQIPPAEQPRIPGTTIIPRQNGIPPNQTKENLDKKEALLNFTKEQKDIFIKLLVLLQWSKDVEGVSKVIDLNRWLRDRISQYGEIATGIARMKRYLAFIQLPNPDLKTAAEVLSRRTVTGFSDLGYIPPKPITNKQALSALKSLNTLLISRLTLHEDLPIQLQQYRVHDGRVTFYVENEFELDVSVLNESFDSQFYLADFRFTFSPAADFPAGQIFDDLSTAANDVLHHTGLLGCYQFLHDFTLTYKVNLYLKQAQELLQSHWAGNLSVTLIRRTLVVQYWTKRNAAKSWIEIGISSGSKRGPGQSESLRDPSICVRWMRDGKEVEDADLDLNLQHLSMDTFLRQIMARHTNFVFDTVYDVVAANPLYKTGDLWLEQSASLSDPNECAIDIELNKGRMLKVTLEPVTGALVMSPTSGQCSQVQADLNRSRNLMEDLPRMLSYLRVKSAEDNLSIVAEATGWIVLRSFSPTPAEKAKWFPAHIQRSMFLKCPHWEDGHVLAATLSPQGDRWYLLTQEKFEWTSEEILLPSRYVECEITSEYMRSLQNFCSGMIVLRQNARVLNKMTIRNSLETRRTGREDGLELRSIIFEYSPDRSNFTLKPTPVAMISQYDGFQDHRDKNPHCRSYIRTEVTIKYLRHTLSSGAFLELTGSVADNSTNSTVLEYLSHAITDSSVTFTPADGGFSIKICTPVGKPVIDELLDRLMRLETIIACVKAVKASPFSAISYLSLDKIAMQYRTNMSKELGVHLTFPTATRSLELGFSPEFENPHNLIQKSLSRTLVDPQARLSNSIPALLPLLSSTYPLLSLFRELQQEKWHETFGLESELLSEAQIPRIHIMARQTWMFGVQLYAPPSFTPPDPFSPPRTTRMLARFEILTVSRRGRSRWLLRPAIEEFESYSQHSYCCKPLKEKLEQDIFKATEPQGWQPEDSGAVCDLQNPKPLLQAVLGIVVSWMKDYSATQAGLETQAPVAVPTLDPPVPKKNTVQATQNAKTKTSTNANQRTGGNRAVQTAPEVITLDD